MGKSPVIGIDFGTRFSCVGIWRNKRFEVIPDQFGNRTIPSVVAFYRSAKLAGYNALALKEVNPKNTIYDIKRIIGRRMSDPKIEQIKQLITYEIKSDESSHENILVQLDQSDPTLTHKLIYRPEEIASLILSEIKRLATTYLKQEIKKAVLTVPAYFNDAQRQATLDAGKIAGLKIIKIFNEPTAAALAYGLGSKSSGNIIVYDFGAGTLDVSLVNISNGIFKTLAMVGNAHLGGEDIDYLIMNHVLINFKSRYQFSELNLSKLSQLKLKHSVENAKKILSTGEKAVICVDDFDSKGTKLYYVLTRDTFEKICNELFIVCVKPLEDVLESCQLGIDDVDDVILVGGSSRIPHLQKLILDFFSKSKKIKSLTTTVNPDEVVATGAAIYGYIMTHADDPFSKNLVLLDIIPLSLGVQTLQHQMTTIIPRNTVIPTKKTKIFSTDTDNETSVQIKIFEGERKLTKNNFHVGTFELSGFEAGPRGYPTIKITFHIDINGILQVTAHEKRSDVQNTIKITSTYGAKGRLSRSEIDSIIQEASENDHIDSIMSLKINLIHKISSICSAIKINISDPAFDLTQTDIQKIKLDVKSNLKYIRLNTDPTNLSVQDLEKREQYLSKSYAPLIALINKSESSFSPCTPISTAATVNDDDDNLENVDLYGKIQINPNTDYNQNEITSLKKTISDLSTNILNVINNPISKFILEDITATNDYISCVRIWLYTTSAHTTIEFVAKIDEINKFTESLMKKYQPDEIFSKNSQFTIKDELQLTCLTLNTSIKSNFFSLKKDQMETLSKLITQTMIWLIANPNEQPLVYEEKLNQISSICNKMHNSMHNSMHKMTKETVEPIDSDSDSDLDIIPPPTPIKNKINEQITQLIDQLPKKSLRKKKNDVLLKIDINKLNDLYCR